MILTHPKRQANPIKNCLKFSKESPEKEYGKIDKQKSIRPETAKRNICIKYVI